MTAKLNPRQAVDHLFLVTLLSGSRAKRGQLFEKVMETFKAQPGLEHIYEVKVSVNGVEMDFQDFTDEVQRQLDAMVMVAARKVVDEQFADRFREIGAQIHDAEQAAKDLCNAVEAKAREMWGLPPKMCEDSMKRG
jgi:hypothetical protein